MRLTFRSFRSRITLLFGSLALVTSMLTALGVSSLFSKRIVADQGDMLHGLARGVGILLAEGMQERLADIALLAASVEASRLTQDPEALRSSLLMLQHSQPSYSWIGVTDANGKVLHASGRLLEGVTVADRPWYRAALRGEHVGDVHPAKLLAQMLPPSIDGGPVRFLDFAAPVRGASGELLGVIGAHANWDWAGTLINRVRSERVRENQVLFFILDREGRVIHRPVSLPGVPDDTMRVPHGSTPQMLTWPDGAQYLTTSAPVSALSPLTDMGWTVVARQPEAQALASANEAQRVLLGVGLVVALLATVATYWLAGRFSRPLRAIAAAAQRIEGGDLTARMPAEAGSLEVRQLIGALEGMTLSLLQGQQALRAANETLEARVTERTAALAEANRELEYLAQRDALTGLYNRRSADQRLGDELLRHRRSQHPMSVLLIDIDHFKRINDSHGHAVGDDALRLVARCLQAQCRSTDFVARFGGEEFLMLLPETGSLAGALVAEKVRQAVEALQVPVVGQVTVSIGLAEVQPNQLRSSPSQLVSAADGALYTAKAMGRNRVVVGPGVGESTVPPGTEVV